MTCNTLFIITFVTSSPSAALVYPGHSIARKEAILSPNVLYFIPMNILSHCETQIYSLTAILLMDRLILFCFYFKIGTLLHAFILLIASFLLLSEVDPLLFTSSKYFTNIRLTLLFLF